MKDQGELRMFDLFAEAVEDLYTGFIDKYVRQTPALWEEFAQRFSTNIFICVPYSVVKSLRFICVWCIWGVGPLYFP